MDNISLIVKGFIIGIGKIVPGVSGAVIALSLGVYEKALERISNLFKNFTDNIKFLGLIASGICLSVIAGSKILNTLITKYYIPLIFLFIGLIIGGIPNHIKKLNMKKDFLWGMIPFILVIATGLLNSSGSEITFTNNVNSFLIIIGIGIIEAATMIIPGISGTAIMILIGCYKPILNVFSTILDLKYFKNNITFLIPYSIGLIIGIIILSKILNYLFKYYKNKINYAIIGFTYASTILLFLSTLNKKTIVPELLIGIMLMIAGYILSKNLKIE